MHAFEQGGVYDTKKSSHRDGSKAPSPPPAVAVASIGTPIDLIQVSYALARNNETASVINKGSII